jgi:hypothetical protein
MKGKPLKKKGEGREKRGRIQANPKTRLIRPIPPRFQCVR